MVFVGPDVEPFGLLLRFECSERLPRSCARGQDRGPRGIMRYGGDVRRGRGGRRAHGREDLAWLGIKGWG